jgi:small subunit ribosomal protein S17
MKVFTGTVVSVGAQKTASVKISRRWQHPMYQKFVTRSKKYACHYEDLDLQVGDLVRIEEIRPISKTKHFKVVEKLESKS